MRAAAMPTGMTLGRDAIGRKEPCVDAGAVSLVGADPAGGVGAFASGLHSGGEFVGDTSIGVHQVAMSVMDKPLVAAPVEDRQRLTLPQSVVA